MTVSQSDSRAFLNEVTSQAIDTALGKLLAAGLACMLISVARVVQFGTSLEMREDQCYKESVRSTRFKRGEAVDCWDAADRDDADMKEVCTYRLACGPCWIELRTVGHA